MTTIFFFFKTLCIGPTLLYFRLAKSKKKLHQQKLDFILSALSIDNNLLVRSCMFHGVFFTVLYFIVFLCFLDFISNRAHALSLHNNLSVRSCMSHGVFCTVLYFIVFLRCLFFFPRRFECQKIKPQLING